MGKKVTEELKELLSTKVVKLHNLTCIYCSKELSNIENNEEHVIGRKFVPKKSLNNQWNLIVRACKKCNTEKSDLEDDISAISMQPDLNGSHVVKDENLTKESLRKSNSISRRTRKAVLDSNEKLTLSAPFFGGNITLNLISSPQIDTERAFELARLHATAFFYWLTYDEITKIGKFWEGFYFPIQVSSNKDWGSNLNRAFMKQVLDWELALHGVTADGFFKVIIRKEANLACWSWALEWNKNYRVIGLFGNNASIENFNSVLPTSGAKIFSKNKAESISYREEISLSEEDDILFKID